MGEALQDYGKEITDVGDICNKNRIGSSKDKVIIIMYRIINQLELCMLLLKIVILFILSLLDRALRIPALRVYLHCFPTCTITQFPPDTALCYPFLLRKRNILKAIFGCLVYLLWMKSFELVILVRLILTQLLVNTRCYALSTLLFLHFYALGTFQFLIYSLLLFLACFC